MLLILEGSEKEMKTTVKIRPTVVSISITVKGVELVIHLGLRLMPDGDVQFSAERLRGRMTLEFSGIYVSVYETRH